MASFAEEYDAHFQQGIVFAQEFYRHRVPMGRTKDDCIRHLVVMNIPRQIAGLAEQVVADNIRNPSSD